ncbi:hypothetical protein [Microbispora sp. CA-102843]|uniref:hypothetical protein n=1 Tax=Microbispora sp. CA-102843 TaxID=3239952 RepID=UPI003D8FC98D
MLDLRVVAYQPNEAKLGLLPYPLALDAGWPLNDTSSLRLTYSTVAARAEWLAQPCEIAVEWSADGQAWVEPPDSRFLLIKRQGDETDQTGARSFDLPGWSWQLKKLVLYPVDVMVDGKRQFSAVTPGQILKTFIQEGQARGTLPGLAYDFDIDEDSADRPWSAELTMGIEPGRDLLAMLLNLAEQGVIDWQMQGRTLRVFNGDGALNRDLSTGTAPVDLRLGRDVTEAPTSGTWENASNAILIAGEQGLSVEVTSPATLPWGRWETYQQQGGIADAATAAYLGQNLLQRATGERVQFTRGIVLPAAKWLPWRDYRPGDTIKAPGDAGVMAPLRVRQITLTRDQHGLVGGNLTLNDRFLEREIRLARRAAGILDGGIASGGTGGAPAPDATGRVPAAPEGLIVAGDAYIGPDGYARGIITATWSPVVADVNGVAINVDGYQVFARRNGTTQESGQITVTDGAGTIASYAPLQTRTDYAIKVRAVANGTPGEFSTEYVVYVPDDLTPPPVPTAPTLATRLGIIYVTWDGQGVGSGMPADFDRVRVWMSADGGVSWEDVGSLTVTGALVVAGEPYNEERLFRLTAVDRSGNESDPSASASIATVPLVDTDIIGQIISGANIVDGSITASDKIVANSITGALIQALSIQTGHLQANAITADKIEAGAITAAKIAGDAIDGKTITGAFIRTAASGRRLELAPPGATVPEMRFYPSGSANYTVISSRDDIYSGEATLTITTSQNASSNYRARLQMGATMTTLNVMNAAATASRGGQLEIADNHAKFGYYAGSVNSECYIQFDGTGRWQVRGRYWDDNDADPYDAINAGSYSVDEVAKGNIYSYGPTMATNMGPLVTLRDGRSGGPSAFGNTYTPVAWALTASTTTGYQVNIETPTSFAYYWWAHRH